MKKFANTDIYTGGYLADHDFDCAAPRLVQQRQEAKTFLTLLDPKAVFFTFQTFDDDKDKERKDPRLARVLHGSLDERWDELVDLNRKGAGVFVTVNETDGLGRKNSNIIRVRAVFQDDDDGFEGDYPLPPSIEVLSSPGKHQRYWLASGVSPQQFETLTNRLVVFFGGDAGAKGLSRVLRLPGFLHLKEPAHPHLVTLLEPSPGTVYGAEELTRAFLADAEKPGGDIDSLDDAKPEDRDAGGSVMHGAEEAQALRLQGSLSEEEHIASALAALPQKFADDRSLWRAIGMALHSSDLPSARALFDEWSMGSARCGGGRGFPGSAKYDKDGQDKLWNSLSLGYTGAKITTKTLFYHARQHGWVDPKRTYHHSDAGNARRLADRHGLNLRYVVEWGKWLIWQDGRWRIDNNFEIERLAKETIAALWQEAAKLDSDEARTALRRHALRSESARSIGAMIALARSEECIPINTGQLDSDRDLLGVQNGVIDLRTLTFREGRREDYITKFCGTHYDPEAKCPNWLKFLDRIMGGNHDIIAYLQRFDGYGLTGSASEEVLRILWGKGKNGKSTYRETKRHLLGDYSDTCGVDVLLQKHEAGAATPQLAKLKGLRHISINETKENGKLSEERVKTLASNEPIEARFLHQNSFTFMPTHKIDITTNHKPIVTGTDEGIWRRIHLVPFTVTIPEEERDEHYREKYLDPELAGILNWMLEGLKNYREMRLKPPREIQAATRAYRAEMDVIEQWLEDRCQCHPQLSQSLLELYEDYVKWVGSEFGQSAGTLSKRKFGDALSERGFEPASNGRSRLRKGLTLRD